MIDTKLTASGHTLKPGRKLVIGAGVAGVTLCLMLASGLMAQTADQGDETRAQKKKSATSQSAEPYYVDGVEYKPYVPEKPKAQRRSVSGADGGLTPAPDVESYPVFNKPVPAQEVTPVAPGPAPAASAVSSSGSSSASAPPRVVAPGVAAMPGTLSGAATSEAPPAANPQKRQRYSIAIVRALDKVTAESVMFEARIGQPVRFKGLVYNVRACETGAPGEARPDVIAYLEVRTNDNTKTAVKTAAHPVFRGWTFASSPGLNPMQHAVYDAWVIACKNPIS
jgi:hypothetical protein